MPCSSVSYGEVVELIECMKMAASLADANGKDGVGTLLRQAIAAIEQLKAAGRKVVKARYGGDDWDALKNAIGELEDIVGRPRD